MVPGLVDVNETAMQAVVDFDCGGVVTVFSERSLPPFALVVLLRVRPAINCMLCAIMLRPVSFTKR